MAGEVDFFGLKLQLPPPLDTDWGAFAVTVLAWAAVAALVYFFVGPMAASFTRRTRSSLDDKVVAILRPAVFAFIVLAGTKNSLTILANQMSGALLALLFELADIGVILLAGYVAFRIFKEVVLDYGHRLARSSQSRVDDVLIPALDKLGAVFIAAATFVALAARAGVDLSVLLAGGAFAGLVVGLAAQESLANFFAGLHIIFDQPFKVGDTIQLETGEMVDVREIGMRSCKLFYGYNGSVIILPNQVLARSKIVNYTRPDSRFRVKIEVGVAYAAEPARVALLLKETALSFPEVLKEPGFEPVVRLSGFGDSSVDFDLLFWIKDHAMQWALASDMRVKILQRLKAEGIEIPFPQRVVHVRGGTGERAEAAGGGA